MKKHLIIMAAALSALIPASCTKEILPQEPDIVFQFTVSDLDAPSRAMKSGLETGDVLHLWFVPITKSTPDMKLTFDGEKWNARTTGQMGDLQPEGIFQVVYSGKNDLSGLSDSFSSNTARYLNQSKDEGTVYIDGNSSLPVTVSDLQAFSENVKYVLKDGVMTATISQWSFLSDFQVTLTDVPGGEYALQCKTNGKYVASVNGFLVSDGSVRVSGRTGDGFVSAKAGRGELVFHYARLNTKDADAVIDLTLIPRWSGKYSTENAITYSVGSKTLKAAGTRQGVTIPYTKFTKVPEAVDLGLSVKWGSFNLGAAFPGEFGYLYAFGELEPKSEYYWDTYLYCRGDFNRLTKYCPSDMEEYWYGDSKPDNKKVLDLSDDAANVKLGGKWRIPTRSEWEELLKCEWTWDTQYGLNGYTVTGKTGKTIFLPAAGSGFMDRTTGVGNEGNYWSSNVYEPAPYQSWQLHFNTYIKPRMTFDSAFRFLGYSVRPVLGK